MSMSITIYPPSISIHAPRTGSDDERGGIAGEVDFNPRSPHGERPITTAGRATPVIFQSTLPARGATHEMRHTYISIIFQSTLPARGATRLTRAGSGTGRFQSTLPARGATA